MTIVRLSKILEQLQKFQIKDGLLCITKGAKETAPWDMYCNTIEEKLDLFLYVLGNNVSATNLYIGFESIHIEDDISEFDCSVISQSDYRAFEPELCNYNISTANYPKAHRQLSFLTMSLEEFAQIADRPLDQGFSRYISTLCSSYGLGGEVEEYYPTKFFVTYNFGGDTAEFLAATEKLSNTGIILNYANVSYALRQKRLNVQIPSIPPETIALINGMTNIDGKYLWWEFCRLREPALKYTSLLSFYNYLIALPQPVICFSSEYLKYNANTSAESMHQGSAATSYEIPIQIAYLLALVHINTGKHIEFINFHYIYEEHFIEAVNLLASRKNFDIYEQLKAYLAVQVNDLCILKRSYRYIPAKVVSKQCDFIWKAISLNDIASRLIIQDSKCQLSPGLSDPLSFAVLSNENTELPYENLIPIIEILTAWLDSDEHTNLNLTEEIIYQVLRLFEQMFFEYKNVLNISDLFGFYLGDTVYLGCASFKAEYEIEAYICSSSVIPVKDKVTALLPTTILLPESHDTEFMDKLLQHCETQYKALPIDDLAVVNTFLFGLTKNTNNAEMFTEHELSQIKDCPLLRSFLLASFFHFTYQQFRLTAWEQLTKCITAFGLRNLTHTDAPLNIFGGITTRNFNTSIDLYPVALQAYPKEVSP